MAEVNAVDQKARLEGEDCFEVTTAHPNVTTLLAVNTLDKYELNDVLSGEPDSRDMKNGFALIIAFHDSRVAAPSIKYTQRIRGSPRISCGREISMIVWSLSESSCSTSVVIRDTPPRAPTSEPDARIFISERFRDLRL